MPIKLMTALTAEQEAQIAVCADQWATTLRGTAPADRPRAERAARDLYLGAGLDEPRRVIWTESPNVLLHCLALVFPPPVGSSRPYRGSMLLVDEYTDELELLENELAGVRPNHFVYDRSHARDLFPTSPWHGRPLATILAAAHALWGRVNWATRDHVAFGAAWRQRWARILIQNPATALERHLADRLPRRNSGRAADLIWLLEDGIDPDAVAIRLLWETNDCWIRKQLRADAVRRAQQPHGSPWWRDQQRRGRLRWNAGRLWWGGAGLLESAVEAQFLRAVCRVDVGPPRRVARAALEVFSNCAGLACVGDVVLLCDRPERLELDPGGRLHSETGPAARYRDGWSMWAWHGFPVPRRVIESPETLQVSEILREQNAELRRILMERYGTGRFLRDAGAETVQQDDCGTLYRLATPDEEPLVMVRVINSTPEPDGTFREYFLRVPPTMRRAREAVAWTFGQNEADYAPETES